MSSIHSSRLLVPRPSSLSSRRIFAETLEFQAKKSITSEISLIIRLLMGCCLERTTLEFFLDASKMKMQIRL